MSRSTFVADSFFHDTSNPSPWANALDYNDMMYSGITDEDMRKGKRLENAHRYDKIFDWNSTTPILSTLFNLLVTSTIVQELNVQPFLNWNSTTPLLASVFNKLKHVYSPARSKISSIAGMHMESASSQLQNLSASAITPTATYIDDDDEAMMSKFTLPTIDSEEDDPYPLPEGEVPWNDEELEKFLNEDKKTDTYYKSKTLNPIHKTFKNMLRSHHKRNTRKTRKTRKTCVGRK